MADSNAVSTLNHLVAIAKDGVAGMQRAAENATSPQIQTAFRELSAERGTIATQLQDLVRRHGGNPDDSGTTLGAAHRTFMSVKDAVTGSSDEQLIDEGLRGEDAAIKEFEEAQTKGLPTEAVSVVQSALTQIRQSRSRIESMRASAMH